MNQTLVTEVVEPIVVALRPAGRYTSESYELTSGKVKIHTNTYLLGLKSDRTVYARQFNTEAADSLGITVDFSQCQEEVNRQVASFEQTKRNKLISLLEKNYGEVFAYLLVLQEKYPDLKFKVSSTREQYIASQYVKNVLISCNVTSSLSLDIRVQFGERWKFECSSNLPLSRGHYERTHFNKLDSMVKWTAQTIADIRYSTKAHAERISKTNDDIQYLTELTGIVPKILTKGYMTEERVVGYSVELSESRSVTFRVNNDKSISEISCGNGPVTPEQFKAILNVLKGS